MKILDISAENNGKTGGKKELGAAEKWLRFQKIEGEYVYEGFVHNVQK